MATFWTAMVGVAGIVATFFAPTWAHGRIERRRERREFRRARRLVTAELDLAESALSFVAAQDVVPTVQFLTDPSFIRTEGWEAERPVLATLLSEEMWKDVSEAYTGIAIVRRALVEQADSVEQDEEDDALDADQRGILADVCGRVRAARDELLVASSTDD